MNRGIKTILSMTLVAMMGLNLASCGQDQGQNQSQDQSSEQSEQHEEASEGFSPKYSSDTEYKLSVVGTYSNFESLESTIDRF